jgi:hypothetical protein
MTDKEFIQALRAILQVGSIVDNKQLLAVIVDLMIRANGGKTEFNLLREAQEVSG